MMTINKKESGNIMLIMTLVVALVGTAAIISSTTNSINDIKDSQNLSQTKQSIATAESSFEDVLYRLKTGKQVSTTETLSIGNSNATTSINNIGTTIKEIISNGIFKSNEREISTRLTTAAGVSFSYGMQTGQGGIVMGSNSGIVGSIYTNGSILGSNGAYITGSAIAANGNAATADQSNGVGTPLTDNTFGTINGNQDIAQSFVLSNNNTLAKIQVYIKKVGSPSSPTVTIRNDNSGSPGSTIIATGTLNSSLVTTSYGWIDVLFSSYPQLNAGTTYWLTIDTASNNVSNYYIIGGDSNYSSGTAKNGRVGNSWTQVGTNTDLFFGIYTGGALGVIDNVTIGTGSSGIAHANTVTNSTIAGDLYCKTGSGNNKSCDTSKADPVPQQFPVSDSNINDWKNIAQASGITTGNVSITGTQTLNGQKITGNLTVGTGADLTLNGTIWVVGDIILNNNAIVRIPSSYGANGGIIITDGVIDLGNNSAFQGSGTPGSYIMAISTSTSANAISVYNNAGSVILYAPHGTAVLSNNATADQITAYKIIMGSNATVTYNSGLINQNFSTGPSGTWQIDSWKESE